MFLDNFSAKSHVKKISWLPFIFYSDLAGLKQSSKYIMQISFYLYTTSLCMVKEKTMFGWHPCDSNPRLNLGSRIRFF